MWMRAQKNPSAARREPLGVMRTHFRPPPVSCSALAAVALHALGAPLRAQSIRVVVVDPSGSGVAGGRGESRLAASAASAFRVRTLRIGFRPITFAPIVLAAGQEVVERFEAVTPVEYSALDSQCGVLVIWTRH